MNDFTESIATEFEALVEREISSEAVFDGRLLHVRRDRVALPNGDEVGREYLRHPGAAAIVPLTEDGRVYVERQFRYPLGEVITEIPAGKLDPGEDPLEAAKRELREETGLSAVEWIELGVLYPAAAYTDERLTMFLARGLTQGESALDDDELLNVVAVPLDELVDAIMRGEIPDSKTQVALLKTARLIGA